MSIEVISFILLRIMPVIFIIGFVFYLVNAFRYREIAFRYLLNADWMPYVYKAEICLAGVFSLIFVDLLEIKNFIILTVILGLTIILLIWIIFTDIFHKQEEKNRLYRELIYVWNQEDLTDWGEPGFYNKPVEVKRVSKQTGYDMNMKPIYVENWEAVKTDNIKKINKEIER